MVVLKWTAIRPTNVIQQPSSAPITTQRPSLQQLASKGVKKKSTSLTNICPDNDLPQLDRLLDSCSKYLDSERNGNGSAKREKVRIIPIQVSRDHPSIHRGTVVPFHHAMTTSHPPTSVTSPVRNVDDIIFHKPVTMSSSLTTDSSGSDFGLSSNRKSLPKKPVKSFIVPKMRRMFEKSKSAEPETLSQMDRPLSSSPGTAYTLHYFQELLIWCWHFGMMLLSIGPLVPWLDPLIPLPPFCEIVCICATTNIPHPPATNVTTYPE